MDLRSLKYFTVVAQELNITRAAEKLNMSLYIGEPAKHPLPASSQPASHIPS